MTIITTSPLQTKKIARELAKKIINNKNKKAFIIGLEGDLGSGKTTFIQGLAKELGIKQKITSPTFVIFKKYLNFYHIDCYRLNNSQDLIELGFKEMLNNSKNIIAIEWASKVKKILPQNTLWLKFEHKGEDKREIIIN